MEDIPIDFADMYFTEVTNEVVTVWIGAFFFFIMYTSFIVSLQVDVFLRAVREGDTSEIRSPYRDAARTYALTYAIRRSAEADAAKREIQ